MDSELEIKRLHARTLQLTAELDAARLRLAEARTLIATAVRFVDDATVHFSDNDELDEDDKAGVVEFLTQARAFLKKPVS